MPALGSAPWRPRIDDRIQLPLESPEAVVHLAESYVHLRFKAYDTELQLIEALIHPAVRELGVLSLLPDGRIDGVESSIDRRRQLRQLSFNVLNILREVVNPVRHHSAFP